VSVAKFIFFPPSLKIRILEITFGIIPAGTESAEIFGILKTDLEKSGNLLDDFDLIIR